MSADGALVCEVTAGSAPYQPPMKPWVLDLAGLLVPFLSNLGIGSELMRVPMFQRPGSL